MKYISKILAILLFVGIVTSCHREEPIEQNFSNTEVGVFGDEMRIQLNVVAPDPVVVNTRAVDPDGKTLQSLNLFCFDANGLFLTTSTAQIKSTVEDKLSGTISAVIPKTTRIIHLLGNQNMSVFDKDAYVFKTEDDVLSALEGSAGMLIYWARIEAPVDVNGEYTEAQYENKDISERTDAEAFVDWLTIETIPTDKTHRGINGKGNPIVLLRNQAKFTIVSEGVGSDPNDPWKGDNFEVTGFVVCNSPAFGTVAPYHVEYGFPTYACSTFIPEFSVVNDFTPQDIPSWLAEKPVTLPARRDKMSDIIDVSNSKEQYVFETNNYGTDPVDLILRGRNRAANGVDWEAERYYYRVNIINTDGEFEKILRNHHYVIHIQDELTNGCLTFEEALTAPPTNNIWLSISDEVKSVRNNDYVLSVDETKVIVEANAVTGSPKTSELVLKFSVKSLGEGEINTDRMSVTWVEDDQKISSTFNPSLGVGGDNVKYDSETGEGTITLNVNNLAAGSEYERGSIVVKYGHLQRKIRIILMRTKEFVPTWVSSEVYGLVDGTKESRSNVTVVFNIPDNCPEELFPMDVLVTTNGLDGRAATGQVLPIVRAGEDDYGDTFDEVVNGTNVTDIGYKYKYTVKEPGQHRLYFENILNMEDADVEYVTLQAKYFENMHKVVTYVDHENKIVLPNMLNHTINPGVSEEEKVKYILVPQKRFAPVVFDIRLEKGGEDPVPYTQISTEEFLFYSSNLDHFTDSEERIPKTAAQIYQSTQYNFSREDFDCYFKPYAQNIWSTGGRIYGFYPREGKVNSEGYLPLDENNCFQIYMETNKPHSAEVVRVASNQRQSTSVVNDRLLYAGETFRSTTFELANYRPFRFAAQVKVGDADYVGNYVGDDATSGTQNPEVVDNIQFTYLPNETIAVSFDVTSFHTGEGENMISVDPFGHAFEIFIDAPMLKLEYGMNKDEHFEDIYEDVLVEMFDKNANGEGYTTKKPKLEDLGNGRFVYRVEASYARERGFWLGKKPLIKDEKVGDLVNGDRKTIYFKKNSIVSNGTITISANPDHVTYHSKTFKVTNTPITGRLGYMPVDADGVAQDPQLVPAEHFVSFTRVYDGSRIGSLAVKEDPHGGRTTFELRLRAEYDFNWENDPIKIQTQVDGQYYSATIRDLKTLYNMGDNRQIMLTLETGVEKK